MCDRSCILFTCLLGLIDPLTCEADLGYYLHAIWACKYLTCEMGLSCPFIYISGPCYIISFPLGLEMIYMFSDALVVHLHGSLVLEWVYTFSLRVNSIKDLASFCRLAPIKCTIVACSYNQSLLEGERGFVYRSIRGWHPTPQLFVTVRLTQSRVMKTL